jgi:aminoglycoside 3-N-acetyltransferase
MIKIQDAFNGLGVCKSDVVMIHGNAGVAAQYIDIPPGERIKKLFDEIVDAMNPNGTIIVPTFSYSFTEGNIFDPSITPSKVGQFSEYFRLMEGVKRTRHPIFSVGVKGAQSKLIESADITTCFGKNSIFQYLHDVDAKIICMGCDFERVTFSHFVEQSVGVPYRYLKNFEGMIREQAKIERVITSYYVRDIELQYQLDLKRLKRKLEDENALKVASFGRFNFISVSARDFYRIARGLLLSDPFSLVSR